MTRRNAQLHENHNNEQDRNIERECRRCRSNIALQPIHHTIKAMNGDSSRVTATVCLVVWIFIHATSQLIAYDQLEVEAIVKNVSEHLNAPKYIQAKGAELMVNDPNATFVPFLITLATSDDASKSAAAHQILAHLAPFPFDAISGVIKGAESRAVAEALWLLNYGAKKPEEIKTVTDYSKVYLTDGRSGFRVFGDQRAFAKEGLRVADVAYNILVKRQFAEKGWPLIVTGETTYSEREQLIKRMLTSLGKE